MYVPKILRLNQAFYAPRSLRLKQEDLVRRWEGLAAYIREVPPHPAILLYENVLNTEWLLTAHREHENQDLVFLGKMYEEDIRAFQDVGDGGEVNAVVVEYVVSSKVPFISRQVDATHLRREGNDARRVPRQRPGLRKRVRAAGTAMSSGSLSPDKGELDELLEYLSQSKPVVRSRP